MNRRVVITGMGIVSPLGIGLETNWSAAVEGRSGIGPITRFDASKFRTRFAGEVKGFDPLAFMDRKDVRSMDLFIQFAMAAAEMAIQDSGIHFDKEKRERIGVITGSGLGGLPEIEATHTRFVADGPGKISPFFIPRLIANLVPGHISIRYGLKGPNLCTVSACASSAHAIGEAFRYVKYGLADVMVTGGSEATISALCIGGFNAMRALSERNDAPQSASRPFDKNRDGFVCAEGGAMLLIESLEHAVDRGARIYAEIGGYGATGDGFHITAPPDDGEGGARCMDAALQESGLRPSDVDYINAHGTSTPQGDSAETRAIKTVFKDHVGKVAVSSTKSVTGHMLGGTGAVEAVFCVLAIVRKRIPPTINYETQDPDCDLDYTPNQARTRDVKVAISNSFGFGGTNATLLFKEFKQ